MSLTVAGVGGLLLLVGGLASVYGWRQWSYHRAITGTPSTDIGQTGGVAVDFEHLTTARRVDADEQTPRAVREFVENERAVDRQSGPITHFLQHEEWRYYTRRYDETHGLPEETRVSED